MTMRRIKEFKGATSAAAIAASLLIGNMSAHAQTIENTSFETGNLDGWNVGGGTGTQAAGSYNSSGVGVTVVTGMTDFQSVAGTAPGSHSWTVVPYDTYMASLQAGGNYTFANGATDLGLTATSQSAVAALLTSNPTNAAWIYQDLLLNAGDSFEMAWQYVSTDYDPFNDASLTSLVNIDNNSILATVNNNKDQYALLGATVLGTGNYSTGNYGATGWQVSTYSVDTSGTYRLGFLSLNLSDTVNSPVLFVDQYTGTTYDKGVYFAPIGPNPGSNAPVTPSGPVETIISGDTNSSDLGDSGNFQGGTLTVDEPDSAYSQDFGIGEDGAVIDQNGNDSTFSGAFNDAVEGTPGSLSITNSSTGGSITLTGTNGYTGDTTIAGGTTLALTGDGSIEGSSKVIADGTFDIGGTNDGASIKTLGGAGEVALGDKSLTITDGSGSFDGAIGGTGGFALTGGELTLNGTNTYTGGTTIAGGTLIGSTNSLTGDVLDNAALVIDQDSDGGFSGDISGSGSLTKDGTGAVTLTGANSYTGGTIIAGGTLIGSANSLTGDVLNNAALELAQPDDATFDGTLYGSGSLLKSGAGTLTISGAHGFSGNTTVSAGGLTVDGDLRGSAITLQDGTMLAGSGIVGGIDAASGSMVSVAGDGLGTMLVDGDVAFASGSNLIVNANAAGEADMLSATGTVTIAGGTVQVLAAYGDYAPQTGYTIISGGTVEGSFDNVQTDLAFLMPTLQYSATGVGLVLTRNDIAFADIAVTYNQASVGGAINAAFASESELYYAIVGQSAKGARAILDNLSGEIHATVANALVQDSDRNRRAVLGRLDLPKHDGPALWIQGVGAQDDWSSDRNAAGYQRNSTGVIGGLELTRGKSKMGIAIGYTDGSLKLRDRLSNAKISGKHLDLYAGSKLGPINLSAGAQIADFDVDTNRDFSLGSIDQQAAASYDAKTYGAFARAGIQMPLGNGAIEPFIGVNWIRFDRRGFAENGGTLALDGMAEKSNWTFGSIGFKSQVPLDPAKRFAVTFSGEWQHALDGKATTATMRFAAGDPSFTVAGAPLARDAAIVDIAANYKLSDRLTIGAGYSGTIANYGMSNAGRANVSLRF